MLVIKAKKRNEGVNLNTLRKTGEIPAVFYGAGKTSTSISLSIIEFKKIWREAGESSTVKISLDDNNIDALIHEVQVHPVTEEPIHVDFLVIDINKKIRVKVPLEFIGISNAVKNGLGNLVKVLYEVEVEALPKDLPHNLTIDIGSLTQFGDQILAKDIQLSSGLELKENPEEVVVTVAAPREEKEEEAAPIDLSAIEVEKKGKEEVEASGEASTETEEKKEEGK